MDNLRVKFNKVVVCRNLEELQSFSKVFVRELTAGTRGTVSRVVGLSGDLGAGKTTFSKAVAEVLGVGEVVSSPTFAIQKQYKTQNAVFEEFVHIDAYRIEDIKEVETLRFAELFSKPKTLVFIEWPEKIAEVLPRETIVLSFETIDENTRKISY